MSQKVDLHTSWDYDPNIQSSPDYQKVEIYCDDYLNGAAHFQQRAVEALEDIEPPNYTDSQKQAYKLGLEEAIEIIKNLKA